MPRYFAPEERYNKFKQWREQRNLDAAGQGPQAPADPVWQSVARNVGTGPAPVLPPAPQPTPMPPPQLSVPGDWMQNSAPAIAPSTPVPSSMTVPSAWLAPYSEPAPLRLPKVPAFSAPPSTPPDGMNWQTADQMAAPPTPTIPMPTRPYRSEAVDADLDALAAVPRDLAGAGLGAYNEFIGRPVTGLATELAGGREQEAYERQRGLPERADTGGDLGNWWRALSERQRARAEAGIASVPLGDVLPFTPGEYAGIARNVAPVARGLLGEVGAVAKSAPVAKGLQAVDRLATSPIVGKIAPGLGIEDVSKAAPDSPTFYSQLERAVASPKAPNRAPAEQWRGILNAQGVKSDELRWTGVDDLLSERAGRPVTRAELQTALDQNRVNVQEVTKGGPPTLNWQEHDGGLYDLDHGLTVEPLPNGKYRLYARGMGDAGLFSTADEAKVAAQEIANREVAAHPRTKFGQYQLPGGENYRELLMTLPAERMMPAGYRIEQRGNGYVLVGKYGDMSPVVTSRDEAAEYVSPLAKSGAQYRSSHWDEPNVLAHVRFNTRTAPDGKKVLFIEEVQSDWHQAGRQKGYSDPAAAEAVSHEHSALLTQLHERYGTTRLTDLKKYLTPEDEAAIAKLNERYAAVSSGPPAAPFSKTWPELALKRMIRWASENGYDRIAWTTGKQQAERYDLAKQVESIAWKPKTGELQGQRIGAMGAERLANDVTPEKLPDYVGKEVAAKLLQQSPDNFGWHALSGLDLSVGGEGMQGFYDRILPETANKLGKKFGARVSTTQVDTLPGGAREYGDVLDRAENPSFKMATVHSLDLSPALKAAAMKEGFPLFVPPEIGGAVAGGAYGAAQPAESERERAQNIIKGAAGGALVGSGARAAGKVLASRGTKGPFGERLGLQADADRFLANTERRQAEIEARLAEIEPKLEASYGTQAARSELRDMGGTIQRPPRAGSLTNAQLEEIAAEHGVSPYVNSWWEALDDEAFKERGPGQRSGKRLAPKAPDKAELAALNEEYAALTAEKERLNQGFEAGYQAAYDLPAASSAESSPVTPATLGQSVRVGGETPLRPSGNPPGTIVPPAEQGGALMLRGRALFTPEQLAEFDRLGIDVSNVPEQYKSEALGQLTFQQQNEVNLASPDYNDKVRAEYAAIEARSKERTPGAFAPTEKSPSKPPKPTPTKKPLPPEIEQPIQQGAQQELQGQGQPVPPPRPSISEVRAPGTRPAASEWQAPAEAPKATAEPQVAGATPPPLAEPPTAAEAGGNPPTPPKPPTTLRPPVDPNSSLPTVKPTSEILAAAYNPDWVRRVVDKFDNPITRNVAQATGIPKQDTFTRGLVLRESIMGDWRSAVTGAMAKVRQQGDSTKLFSVDKQGLANVGGKKVALTDVLEYPGRYALTAEQQRYAKTIHQLYDDQKNALLAEGIDIRELGFEEGGHYVGRKVVGKMDDEGNIELAQIGGGTKRVGGKAGFEKGRTFATQEEAVAAGFAYMPPEEALQANLQAAGKKIADQRLADYILERIPYRTASAPVEIAAARDLAQKKLEIVAKLKTVINRGYRGERVPPSTIKSIGRFFPQEAADLLAAKITRTEDPIARAGLQSTMQLSSDPTVNPISRGGLQGVEARIPTIKAQAQAEFYKARDAMTRANERARQPKYGESMVQSPAFQGKFFSEADAKKLRQTLDLEQHSPLRGAAQSVSWVNALPRLLLTTFDLGPALIQGQLALFSHPIVWSKAFGRSMQALVPKAGEKGYQTFLATHADTIKEWSRDGAIFSPSEFTAAVGQGGIATKVPVLKTAIQPFARSFEALLNAGRIYGLEATGHLAKTPQDRVQLAKFWNEMTGVVDTARMGVSPTQREVETAVMFAPRYRRAVLALMSDVAKGGLRGKQARDAIGKATLSGLATYLGVWGIFNRIAPDSNPSPHLDPAEGGKFLTVNIFGQNIGLGGTYYSTTRTLLQMAIHPDQTAELAAKYVKNAMSPAVGTAVDAYQHPFAYDTLPKFTKEVIAGNFTPIWAQSYLVDGQEGAGALAATLGEMTGARTFPDTPPGGSSRRSGFAYPGPKSGRSIAPHTLAPKFAYPGGRR